MFFIINIESCQNIPKRLLESSYSLKAVKWQAKYENRKRSYTSHFFTFTFSTNIWVTNHAFVWYRMILIFFCNLGNLVFTKQISKWVGNFLKCLKWSRKCRQKTSFFSSTTFGLQNVYDRSSILLCNVNEWL